jgi:hypothetical protein
MRKEQRYSWLHEKIQSGQKFDRRKRRSQASSLQYEKIWQNAGSLEAMINEVVINEFYMKISLIC